MGRPFMEMQLNAKQSLVTPESSVLHWHHQLDGMSVFDVEIDTPETAYESTP